jgi:methylglyoxal synthase
MEIAIIAHDEKKADMVQFLNKIVIYYNRKV